jgi:hypothetical protein
MKANMEFWLNDYDGGKLKYSRKSLSRQWRTERGFWGFTRHLEIPKF